MIKSIVFDCAANGMNTKLSIPNYHRQVNHHGVLRNIVMTHERAPRQHPIIRHTNDANSIPMCTSPKFYTSLMPSLDMKPEIADKYEQNIIIVMAAHVMLPYSRYLR